MIVHDGLAFPSSWLQLLLDTLLWLSRFLCGESIFVGQEITSVSHFEIWLRISWSGRDTTIVSFFTSLLADLLGVVGFDISVQSFETTFLSPLETALLLLLRVFTIFVSTTYTHSLCFVLINCELFVITSPRNMKFRLH